MRPIKRSASALRIRTTRTVSDVTAPVEARIISGRSISPITSRASAARSSRAIDGVEVDALDHGVEVDAVEIRSMSTSSMAICVTSSLSTDGAA